MYFTRKMKLWGLSALLLILPGCETLPEELAWLAPPEAATQKSSGVNAENRSAQTVGTNPPIQKSATESVKKESVNGPSRKNAVKYLGVPAEIPPTRYGDWELSCGKALDGCRINQIVSSTAGPVMLVLDVVIPADKRQARKVIVKLPLGFHIPYQPRILMGGAAPHFLDVQSCNPQGCLVEASDPARLIMALKDTTKAPLVELQASETRENIQIGFSFKGFRAAYESVATD